MASSPNPLTTRIHSLIVFRSAVAVMMVALLLALGVTPSLA